MPAGNTISELKNNSITTTLSPPPKPKLPPSSAWMSDRVAVIIETRPLTTLIPLLLHFAAVLGPAWPVILYTTNEHAPNISETPSVIRMSHQIEVRTLPNEISIIDRESTSKFLTKTWLWEHLAPAEHILLFQSDSVICGNAQHSINEFLEYDFIGAPIGTGYGRGYNGGLSLRRRSKMLRTIKLNDWEEQSRTARQGQTDGYNLSFEDQWFVYQLRQIVHHRLPPVEVAQKFAVETMWYDKPLGFHQPYRYLKDKKKEIEAWCPEVKLTVGGVLG